MAKVQHSPLAPPSQVDGEQGLPDYTAKIQESFTDLYESAHDHEVRSSTPTSSDGAIGDILLIDDGTNKYLAVRYEDGWYKTNNLASI